MLLRSFAWLLALPAAALPHRLWARLPWWLPIRSAAFIAGILTLLAGMAIGIPGFLNHAGANVSIANQGVLDAAMRDPGVGYERGAVAGAVSLSIFTFLFLTTEGWLTLYLVGTGGVRAASAWFDDPVGDPLLTGLDEILLRTGRQRRDSHERGARQALEGPEVADRIVSAANAEIPGCDLVIVSSRRKPGWERGVVVYTAAAVYRIGQPVERTIAGRGRTLYPLTEHTDLEAVRKSVQYDMPDARARD